MIPLFKVKMSPKAKELAAEVLDSGFVGQGPKNEEFENLLKKRFNTSWVATVNSATSGLHLALHLLKKPQTEYTGSHSPPYLTWPGLTEEDEVLTSPLTCTATNWPIIHNNLKIKWVDVDPVSCNMDLKDLERKLSPKTKVILLIHWGGNPIDLNKIKDIQSKCLELYGFKPAVIEDCAHAMGALYNGKLLGSHGNICVYSFQAIKHFTTVDGGCIIFPTESLYKRAKLLRWFGIDRENNRTNFRCDGAIEEAGFKYHMNDLNSAIGIANFELIDEVVEQHYKNAYHIVHSLKSEFITFNKNQGFDFPGAPSFWMLTLNASDKVTRDKFIEYMTKNNIQTSRVHERNDIHPCMKEFRSSLPGVTRATETMICVPCGWWLTKENLEHIVKTINSFRPY